MLLFEEVLSFRRGDAADEKRLILHTVPTNRGSFEPVFPLLQETDKKKLHKDKSYEEKGNEFE